MSNLNKTTLLFPLSLVLLEIATYLANDMYLPGLPRLAKDFNIVQDMAQYTLLVWFMGSASMQLIIGPLSDRFGRRIIILIGAFLFTLTSAVCAYTSDFTLFLISRFVQGATICTVVVAGYAAIHERFDSVTAIKVIGIMGSITVLAPAFGPLSGSIVLLKYTWREIFWVLTLMGVFSCGLLFLHMPETITQRSHLRLNEICSDYFNILRNKNFMRYTLSVCFLFVAFISWIVESPFVIMKTYARSEIEFGIIQLFVFGAFMIGAQLTRLTIDRFPAKRIIRWGQVLSVLSVVGLVLVSVFYTNALKMITFMMMINSIGTALIFGPLHRLAIDACNEPMGRRMAVSSTLNALSGVLAIYVVTLLNDKTMPNLCIPIAGGIMLSILSYWLLRPRA